MFHLAEGKNYTTKIFNWISYDVRKSREKISLQFHLHPFSMKLSKVCHICFIFHCKQIFILAWFVLNNNMLNETLNLDLIAKEKVFFFTNQMQYATKFDSFSKFLRIFFIKVILINYDDQKENESIRSNVLVSCYWYSYESVDL